MQTTQTRSSAVQTQPAAQRPAPGPVGLSLRELALVSGGLPKGGWASASVAPPLPKGGW
jgi:hypothetical protein